MRLHPERGYAVLDCSDEEVTMFWVNSDELDKAIADASGWSKEGERDLRAMPEAPGALRVLVIHDQGWNTLYLIPSHPPITAPGGSA